MQTVHGKENIISSPNEVKGTIKQRTREGKEKKKEENKLFFTRKQFQTGIHTGSNYPFK